MPGKSGFGAARQAAHVHIQQVQAGLVVMLNAVAVLSNDLIQRVLQLRHIFCGAGIQSLLYHRLLGAGRASEGPLQAWVCSQAGIDFYQPVGSGQQADPGIIELVNRRMLDGFLPNLDQGPDRAKETLVDSTSLRWLPG